MKRIACLYFLCVFTNAAYAQSIKGCIVDSVKTPVPFATIAVISSKDSSIIRGSISDENGNFLVKPISRGSYLLRITAIGYHVAYKDSILIDSLSNVDLSFITLNSQGINLNEISVTAIKRTIEFKNGNIIIHVENSALAKGNTVYDLLSKLPGVSIDNNVIKLNGKEGVIIMLDGRVQQLTNTQLVNMLKSMNAETVEKIELLKNPPVKYDAAGTSGMIHIKTKKTQLVGLSGSAFTSCSQGYYPRTMTGMALNYRSRKIFLFSDFDYNYGYYQLIETFDKKFGTGANLTEFSAANTINDLDNSLNYKIGADWLVNEKNTIGFKMDGGPGSYNSSGNTVNTILQYNNLGFDHMNASVYTPDRWNINNYNINAEHKFDTLGTVLNLTSDYTRLAENQSSNIENYFLDAANLEALPPNIYRSTNISATGILASKLDLTKVLTTNASFEAGAKTSFVNTSNNYLFERKDNATGNYYKDTLLSNNYTYHEQTFAAYFNYIRSVKKLNMQLGLRAENTNLTGRNTVNNFEIKRSYYNVFPNISMEYSASKDHNFQLNMNRRIDRPQYNDLNPFRFYRDQYSYFEGNPFLLPHYSNSLDLTYSYKQFITNSFTYTRIDNVMLHYTKQNDTTKIIIETAKNMKVNNYYAYSIFIQHNVKPWWDISANGLLSYIEYIGDVSGVPFKTASFYYSPRVTNTFIHKKTKLEIIAFYNSGKNNGLIQVKPRWMLSFAIKRSFLKEKLDCSIGVNDVFYSGYYRTGVHFSNQDWNFKVTQDSRRLMISVNYNFGKMKIKERETSSNEQEKGRLSH
jgi:hypothetical protein